MDKQNKLVKKVKRLLKRLRCPRWLHHFGPKKYEFWQHLVVLLIRHYCSLSYRRVVKLLDLLDMTCASKSALQYTAGHMPKWIWDRALQATAGMKHHVVAIDSTGFSRTHPSYHYLRRIDGKMPKVPVKLSAALDTKTKKWCAANIRVLPAHDSRDAQSLLEKSSPNIGVLDKGYPAESLYRFAYQQGTLLMIPKKKNAKRGFYRKKMHKQFRTRTYHRRVMVEAGFSSMKRKFGASVSSKKVKTVRAELYGRLLAHNLFGHFQRDLGLSCSLTLKLIIIPLCKCSAI